MSDYAPLCEQPISEDVWIEREKHSFKFTEATKGPSQWWFICQFCGKEASCVNFFERQTEYMNSERQQTFRNFCQDFSGLLLNNLI